MSSGKKKRPFTKGRPTVKPSKPYRRTSELPLDPSYLVQRPLCGTTGDMPIVHLKSTTRHPTVFRKRIARIDGQVRHGDLVRVVADDGTKIGYGYWNPRAEATVRILSWGDEQPTQAWWQHKLSQAVHLRTQLLTIQEHSEAFRLINAEGDGLPGLVVDRYGPILSLQAYTLGVYQRAEAIALELAKLTATDQWLVRSGPSTVEQEGFLATGFESGNVPKSYRFSENDVRFEVHPFEGHKTGFFCDQRENRLRLRDYCQGKTVLDLCCYSGGFSLNAAQGGASQVTGVDLDEEAIVIAKRNANLNQASIRFVHADAFAYMRDMQRNGKTFDVVILDPPKLIRNREEMVEGQRKYFDMNSLAVSLVNPGGLLLTCSCSGLFNWNDFTMTVRAATAERNSRILQRTGPAADHPVAFNCLESDYLKCLWLAVG